MHLPGTLLKDQFQNLSIADALGILAARAPAIEVVGVTDYFSTASYRRALDAWNSGAGKSIKLLFPNVEMRLDTPTTRGSGVNLHLLCAPDQVDNLDRFLGSLEFTWGDRLFRADPDGLAALGRAFRGDAHLNEAAALREGTQQFKVNFDALRRQFRADQWAIDNCIVGLAGGQADGSSGVRADDGGFAARRQAMEAFVHIIFSANPQQAQYWLGRGTDSVEKLVSRYGGQKLCLHGSDAHEAAALGVPDQDRFSWLKGSASFETLRTSCLAPESRAHIGPAPPTVGHGHKRIVHLAVTSPGWFAAGSVPLNPGLVAVIGPRGSGKTALADLVAVGAGSEHPFANTASFVRRAGPLLAGTDVELEWSQGDKTRHRLQPPESTPTDREPAVRYLSQQFVEQLCAADGVSDDLLMEIERVVFNAWPVEQRQGATSFREFLAIRLGGARARQSAELATISQISDAVTDQRIVKSGQPRRLTEREEQMKALTQLERQIAELTKQSGSPKAGRLAVVSKALEQRQHELQATDRRITVLGELADAVRRARDSVFPRYSTELQNAHARAELRAEQWAAFVPEFAGDVDAILTLALQEARAKHIAVSGADSESQDGPANLDALNATDLATRSVHELRSGVVRLRRLVGLDETRTKQLATLNDQSAKVRARIAVLDTEISNGATAVQRIGELTERRLTSYKAYFDALLEEERQLTDLYGPLRGVLTAFGPTVAKLRFSVRRTVDVDSWAKQGEELLDLRTSGSFHGVGELARIASAELKAAWETGDGAAAAQAIKAFSEKYSEDLRRQGRVPLSDSTPYREWERSISRWLYSGEHITLSYSLEYDSVNIARLSPGSRGIVLLLLYLAVDQDETDPLIIDQPEENLDPESVYTELVRLFRSASNRRQIIMVTHNANLVVNTDVDQVIVARCGTVEEGRLPELTYLSGGLEEPTIRQAVCEVLEGGAEAFRQRARRLRLDVLPTK